MEKGTLIHYHSLSNLKSDAYNVTFWVSLKRWNRGYSTIYGESNYEVNVFQQNENIPKYKRSFYSSCW